MKTQYLQIELLEDTVISATAATVGVHESLDHIPGATLLGAAAARLYRKMGDRAFAVFHGPEARFSDALPLVENRIAWPLPLSWHEAKNDPARSGGRIRGDMLHNRIVEVDAPSANTQLKQLRGGHVDLLTGRWIHPHMRTRMKTALEDGTAAEGQLFGYQALPAGQRFVATVSAPDQQLLDELLAALGTEIYIGRSRSAEYGRARLARVEAPALPETAEAEDFTTVYLASDLCLLDAYGQPSLRPQGEQLGLDGLQLDSMRSYVRTRSYAPWNAYRRGHDMDRQVLVRGSVLVFTGQASQAAAQQLERNGAGLYRNQGLGRVLVNAAFVSRSQKPFPQQKAATIRKAPVQVEHPASQLLSLLETRAAARRGDTEIIRHAEKLCRKIMQELSRARTDAGLLPDESFGPSRSQWSRLWSLPDEQQKSPLESLREIARSNHRNWEHQIWRENQQVSLAEWFHTLIEGQKDKGPIKGSSKKLGELIRHVGRLMSREEQQ